MEKVTLFAKPSCTDVNPYGFILTEPFYPKNQNINVYGKSFFSLRNVYVSASDLSSYNGLNYSYFNPFSAIPKLSSKNIGFTATVIPSFTIIGDKQLYFKIPNEFFDYVYNNNTSISLDIIIENEAGYGLLTRDSYSYSVSSWSGFIQYQKPCINGVYVEKS